MAGDHGIVNEGVSAYPQEVTAAMVQTFLAGGAGINAISRHVGAEVWVVDVGIIPELDPAALPNKDRFFVRKVGNGTANFATGPAMTLDEAEKSVQVGFDKAAELFKDGVEILGTGDMGIGNTTPSAAVGIVLTGKGLDDMVGRGTGVDDEGLNRKKEAIRRGLALNNPDGGNGFDVLSKVGGFEIGAIAGSILAATAIVLIRSGRTEALTAALAASNRNMGLMPAAVGASLPPDTWLWFALAQFPIYLLPLIISPMIPGLTGKKPHHHSGAGPG